MSAEYRAFMVRGDDGQEYGPVDLGELREWVQENRAGLGTVVRLDEPDALWQPWQYYPELVALLAEVHVTHPVPGQPGLVIAPLGRRALAFVVDFILNFILVFPILTVGLFLLPLDFWAQLARSSIQPTLPPPQMPPSFESLMIVVIYGGLALYLAGFHAAHGRTPGKSILGVKVVDESGNKPHFVKSFARALLLILSLKICAIPLIYIFFNPQRRTLHDLFADTYVVEA